MPTTLEKHDKRYRMDLRLTQPQRASYEQAASLRGQTLTQWATAHLDESARRDIAEATTTFLSPDAFDAFCEILNRPCRKPSRNSSPGKQSGNERLFETRSTCDRHGNRRV